MTHVELDQVLEIAAVQRQFQHLAVANHLTQRGCIGLHHGSSFSDLHHFRHLAQLHADVHAHRLVHFHDHVIGRELLEPGLFNRNAIAAGNERRDIVIPRGVRLVLERDVGGLIGDAHLGARHQGPRGVADGPQDRAAGRLPFQE